MPSDTRRKQAQREATRRLGALLREMREEAGLRQRDIGEALRRPQQYVSQYESGSHRLDLWELGEVCRALSLPLSDVVRRYETVARGPRSHSV